MPTSVNDWKVTVNSGGRLLPQTQIISQDGKHSIVLFKNQIRVYSLATRQSIRSLRVSDDFNLIDVVDISLSAQNPNHIYIFTSKNKGFVVNWRERLANPVVEQFDLQITAESHGSLIKLIKVVSEEEKEFIFITGKTSNSANSKTPHSRYILQLSASNEYKELSSSKNIVKFALSVTKENLVYLTNKNELIYIRFDGNSIEEPRKISFPFKTPITSLAVSNTDHTIALGTSSGIIQLIYAMEPNRPQRLLKWHIEQVKALEFSSNDAYLLSGGLEKVLVFWQLDTEKLQFLPRLNGVIDNIFLQDKIDDMYQLNINLNEENDLEYLVLSAVDLSSRLNINGVRPGYANPVSLIEKDRKRLMKQNKLSSSDDLATKLKHDFSSNFETHDLTKSLYFPSGPNIQAYDPVKNEQSFVMSVSSTVQIGKVKSETQIEDPKIQLVSISEDGKWMCTFESLKSPEIENLLSSDEIKYSLKFWKYVDSTSNSNTTSNWELCTRIVEPHGTNIPIVAMIPAPSSYYNGQAFLTADNKGGLRLWRPRVPKDVYGKLGKETNNLKLQQTAWTLRKVKPGCGNFTTSSIALAWSQDSSIIAFGQEVTINLIDINTFEEFDNGLILPSLAGSRIRSLKIMGNYLVVLSKNKLIVFDLLTFEPTDLVVKTNTLQGGRNLLTIDTDRNLICLVVNYYSQRNYEIRSRMFIFKPDSLKPQYVYDYPLCVSSIRFSSAHHGFIFVDTDANIGLMTSKSGISFGDIEDQELGRAFNMNTLIMNAKQMASLKQRQMKDDALDVNGDADELSHKLLNASIFEPVLENLEGLPVETLFDRVMRII